MATKKAAKKAAKKPAKKAAKKVVKKKRAAGIGLLRPVQPDAVLGDIIGNKPMPRTQVTKKLWEYIKKNKLQDAKNRRMINADAKLQKLFGGKKQVSMFEMTKLVSKHIS